MKNLKNIFAIILFVLVASCSKDDNPAPTPTPEPTVAQTNVYLVGGQRRPNESAAFGFAPSTPVFWKNGLAAFLPFTAGTNTFPSKVIVSGNDTYVLGSEGIGNAATGTYTSKIILWKNNVQTIIPTTSTRPSGSDIIVENGNVHILGYERPDESNSIIYKYWKNGVAIALTSSASSSSNQVFQMILNNSDIYMCGKENNKAKYWKNGEAFAITDGIKNSSAQSIAVSGNDISILFEEDKATNNSRKDLKIWKNGVVSTIGSSTFSFTGIKISVENNITHVLGREFFNSSDEKVLYWKNGIKTDIANNTVRSYSTEMSVVGNDVAILYYEDNLSSAPNTSPALKYWKNGAVTNLGDGLDLDLFLYNSDVYAINGLTDQLFKNGFPVPIQVDGFNFSPFNIFVSNQ